MHPVTGGAINSPLLSMLKVPKTVIPVEQYEENAAWSSSRYQEIIPAKRNKIKLAIVGGGASVKDHLFTLKFWPGEIWAVKGTVNWLAENGIKSTLVSCHPVHDGTKYKAHKALLSSSCSKDLFQSLSCPIKIFHADTLTYGNKIDGGCTTIGRTMHLALVMGYTEIHYFGCDASMDDHSHIYKDVANPDRLEVVCGGKTFVTQPDWVWQAEYMAETINIAPKVFKSHSGGLLKALLQHGSYAVHNPRLKADEGFVADVPRKRGRPKKVDK